ncbi:MAG TPA: tetratricopeptide repeat protein [Vicinamibacterales bacterium]
MKRKARHQLKENDLAEMIVSARAAFEANKSRLTIILLIAVVAAAVVGGVVVWRGNTDARAEQLLADAMVAFNAPVIPVTADATQPGEVPAAASIGATGSFSTVTAKLNAALPKLKTAADAYPDSSAGITARYHYAASLAAVGKNDEAIRAFDEVASRAGADSLYGRMALFGKADVQARAGQLDAAIATWTGLAASNDEALPKDAILMELGKAYQAAGKTDEARKTFNQLVDEHPTSPYSAEARTALGS